MEDNLYMVRRKMREIDQEIRRHQDLVARHNARLLNLTEKRQMLVRRECELQAEE